MPVDTWEQILMKNKDKNFVQRIMNPQAFPAVENGDGSKSTHMMAANGAKIGGKVVEIVYPTIVQQGEGELVRLGDKEALNYALETGEYIPFDDPLDARKFAAGGYKKAAGWK